MLALNTIRILNDHYCSDTLSVYESAKEFTKPRSTIANLKPVPRNLVDAHNTLLAQCELRFILKPQFTADPVVKADVLG